MIDEVTNRQPVSQLRTPPMCSPRHWWIRDVHPGRSFVIEIPLEQAMLCFRWRFDPLSEQRTRVTQQIELSGSNAAMYVEQLRDAFGSTLADGMKRVVAEMVAAEKAAIYQESYSPHLALDGSA